MAVTARVLKTAMKDSDGKYITFDTLAVNYEKKDELAEPFVRSSDKLIENNEGV